MLYSLFFEVQVHTGIARFLALTPSCTACVLAGLLRRLTPRSVPGILKPTPTIPYGEPAMKHFLLMALILSLALAGGCSRSSEQGAGGSGSGSGNHVAASFEPSADWSLLLNTVEDYYYNLREENLNRAYSEFTSSEYRAKAKFKHFTLGEMALAGTEFIGLETIALEIAPEGTSATSHVRLVLNKVIGFAMKITIPLDRHDVWQKENGQWKLKFREEKYISEVSGTIVNILER